MQSIVKRIVGGMGVESIVIYMAAHGMDIWAVGATCELGYGHGGGYGAGPLDAGVFPQGRWMMTQKDICALDGNYDTG